MKIINLLCYLTISLSFNLNAQLGNGNYTIQLHASGLALEADPANLQNNDCSIRLGHLNTGAAQVWTFTKKSGSEYFITLAASGLALDAAGETYTQNGGQVHLWASDNGFTQIWTIRALGNNRYHISLQKNSKSLDADAYDIFNPNCKVQLWDKNESNRDQIWYLSSQSEADRLKQPINSVIDLANTPIATQVEVNEFKDIRANQMDVAVLGGETTTPFYYKGEGGNETVYKYDKVINLDALPSVLILKLKEKIGSKGFILKPFVVAFDVYNWAKEKALGNRLQRIDSWYPDSEFKKTVCGKLKEDAYICPQDRNHTKLTIDKDINFPLIPNDKFKSMLKNRWLEGDVFDEIEGEVFPKSVSDESTQPFNPVFTSFKKSDNLCVFGPWMADHLDIDLPAFDVVELKRHNEIHPVNQMWYKKGAEIQLTSVVDNTGYFDKTGNGEIQASGLNQLMRYYLAFEIPLSVLNSSIPNNKIQYDINGIGIDFTNNPVFGIPPQTLVLNYNGKVRFQVNDNYAIRNQKTHKVFFDKIRKKADGSIQGFIVIETERILNRGGSININIKLLEPTVYIGDHFYTTDNNERIRAMRELGYQNEGVACHVYPTQIGRSKPLYRLLKTGSKPGCHFYTLSSTERDNVINRFSFVSEGIAGYIFETQEPNTVPLYRLYGTNEDHFYTTSEPERDKLVKSLAYKFERIEGYVFKDSQPNTTFFYRLIKF